MPKSHYSPAASRLTHAPDASATPSRMLPSGSRRLGQRQNSEAVLGETSKSMLIQTTAPVSTKSAWLHPSIYRPTTSCQPDRLTSPARSGTLVPASAVPELMGIWALAASYDQVNNRFATVSAMRTLRFFTGSRRLRTLSIPIRNEPDRLEGQDHAEHRGISDHRAGRQDHRI